MKKSLIVVAAAIGLFLINLIPAQDVNSQVFCPPRWGIVTIQCWDGVGTYNECRPVFGYPPCKEGTVFFNPCSPRID